MLYREVKEYMEGNKKYKENVEKRMATISVDMSRNTLPKPHTIVMVIGESCCRDYMSIYADQEGRETTPWQSEMKKDENISSSSRTHTLVAYRLFHRSKRHSRNIINITINHSSILLLS